VLLPLAKRELAPRHRQRAQAGLGCERAPANEHRRRSRRPRPRRRRARWQNRETRGAGDQCLTATSTRSSLRLRS